MISHEQTNKEEYKVLKKCEGNIFKQVENSILPISSIKMMEGWSFIAREKTAAASFWDSPYHLSVNVEGWRLIKRQPASFAVAFAIKVLPQPGGPYSNTPENQTHLLINLLPFYMGNIISVFYTCCG